MTKEDVTPLWVRKILQAWAEDSTKLPTRTVVYICRGCNASLNETFEMPYRELVAPLIRGDTVSLDAEAQRGVAAWVTKTTLVRSVGDLRTHRASEDRERLRGPLAELMRTGTASAETSVRIGYWPRAREAKTILTLPEPRRFAIPRTLLGGNGIHLGASWGCLKSEVYISLDGDASAVADFARAGLDADRLARVWPPTEGVAEVAWPPSSPLRWADIGAHWDSWESGYHNFFEMKEWQPVNPDGDIR